MESGKRIKKRVKKESGEGQRGEIITDPQGSYTGVCVDDKYEKPVQDADDLWVENRENANYSFQKRGAFRQILPRCTLKNEKTKLF